jgi:hypothetical protein
VELAMRSGMQVTEAQQELARVRFPLRDVEQLFGPSRRRPSTVGLGREEVKIERDKERRTGNVMVQKRSLDFRFNGIRNARREGWVSGRPEIGARCERKKKGCLPGARERAAEGKPHTAVRPADSLQLRAWSTRTRYMGYSVLQESGRGGGGKARVSARAVVVVIVWWWWWWSRVSFMAARRYGPPALPSPDGTAYHDAHCGFFCTSKY